MTEAFITSVQIKCGGVAMICSKKINDRGDNHSLLFVRFLRFMLDFYVLMLVY